MVLSKLVTDCAYLMKRYQEENTYSEGIKFDDTLEVVLQIGEQLQMS